MSRRASTALAVGVLVAWAVPFSAAAQQGAADGQWRTYGGDAGHTKYSALDQINVDNVDDLRIAWTWTLIDEELRRQNAMMRENRTFRTYAYEVTPLVIDGVLYTTTNLGQVAAIEPTTGETIWSYDPGLYLEGRPAVHGGSAPSSGGNSVVLFLSSPPVTQSLPESPGSCSTESAW